jgi:aryl-alcohol dehydrogenase-like predicted oxidoreductase
MLTKILLGNHLMEYINLGRTGLHISRLILGTVNFGLNVTEEDAHAMLNHAFDNGINHLDTANAYNGGVSETILGKWLSKDKSRRDQIVLATKVYFPIGEGPNDGRLSAYHIRRACEASLRRLQTDHIDLYQMHHIDRRTPWEEIWQVMEQLVREGKISYVGSSNFAGWDIAHAQGLARERRFLGLVSEQSVYNLANRSVELEVIPCCRELGVGFIPYNPVGGGLLCGVLDTPATNRRGETRVRNEIKEFRPQLEAYEQFCRDLGEEPANVALAWMLSRPDVTAPIIGPRTMEHLDGNLSALDLKLEEETLAKLDELWAGPGGEAPAAYAW